MDTTQNIPDHLRCPICVDVPKGEVFQCRRGHVLCQECYFKLSSCPTCRVPFEGEPIRNLVMEAMLDELKFECPYQKTGCEMTVDRKSFADHRNCCIYNIARFGAFVNVCNTIAFRNCNCTFQMNMGNVADSIQHLKSLHHVNVRQNADSFTSLVTNYTTEVAPVRYRAILDRKMDGYAYLIISTLIPDENKNKHLSLKAYYWRYPVQCSSTNAEQVAPKKVECCLKGNDYVTWSVTPIDILQSDSQNVEFFSMKVPKNMVVDQYSDVLAIRVKLVESE